MKTNIRKILCAVLVLVMLLSLSGCGVGSIFSITKTAKAMSKVESASVNISTDIDVEMLGTELPLSGSADVDFTVDPFRAEINLDLPEQLDNGSFDIPLYTEYIDGKQAVYYGAKLNDTVIWTANTTELEIPEGELKLDFKTALGMYIKLSDGFEKVGTEKYGSFDSTHYRGTIPEKVINEIVAQNGEGLTIGEVKLSTEDLAKMFGDMTIDFWIDNDSARIVGLSMDMTKATETALELVSGDIPTAQLLSIKKWTISISFTDFNHIDVIEIPEEARAALKSK